MRADTCPPPPSVNCDAGMAAQERRALQAAVATTGANALAPPPFVALACALQVTLFSGYHSTDASSQQPCSMSCPLQTWSCACALTPFPSVRFLHFPAYLWPAEHAALQAPFHRTAATSGTALLPRAQAPASHACALTPLFLLTGVLQVPLRSRHHTTERPQPAAVPCCQGPRSLGHPLLFAGPRRTGWRVL
jgi:hypothetical protein